MAATAGTKGHLESLRSDLYSEGKNCSKAPKSDSSDVIPPVVELTVTETHISAYKAPLLVF